MTETKTAPAPKKKKKRTLLRAVQRMFYDNTLREEGEVFVYVGDTLPSEEIAVRVPAGTPIGKASPPMAGLNTPPPWTTKGFVDQANRQAGRYEDEIEAD